jgi:hypothetical protein
MIEVDTQRVRTSFNEEFPEFSELEYVQIIENCSDDQIASVIKWFRNKGKFARLVFQEQEPSEIILSEYSFAEISQNLTLFTALALEPERYSRILSKVYSNL